MLWRASAGLLARLPFPLRTPASLGRFFSPTAPRPSDRNPAASGPQQHPTRTPRPDLEPRLLRQAATSPGALDARPPLGSMVAGNPDDPGQGTDQNQYEAGATQRGPHPQVRSCFRAGSRCTANQWSSSRQGQRAVLDAIVSLIMAGIKDPLPPPGSWGHYLDPGGLQWPPGPRRLVPRSPRTLVMLGRRHRMGAALMSSQRVSTRFGCHWPTDSSAGIRPRPETREEVTQNSELGPNDPSLGKPT